MADQKISELTALSAAPASDDYFVVLDTDASATKKIASSYIQGVWTGWTPTLTAATTNPTIGNGTLAGRYMQIGTTVFAVFVFTFGSTSNAGSGQWSMSYPVAPKYYYYTGGGWSINDIGTNNFNGFVRGSTSTVTFPYEGSPFYIGSAYPMTWAEGDSFRGYFIYEVA